MLKSTRRMVAAACVLAVLSAAAVWGVFRPQSTHMRLATRPLPHAPGGGHRCTAPPAPPTPSAPPAPPAPPAPQALVATSTAPAPAPYHTLGCGVFEADEWSAEACFGGAGEALPLPPRKAVLTFATVVRRGGKTEPSCGDAYRLRFEAAHQGVYFAARVVEDKEKCGTYYASVRLPPIRGAFLPVLRLIHRNGEGMGEPSDGVMAALKWPSNLMGNRTLRISGPPVWNLRGALPGALHVTDLDPGWVYDGVPPGPAAVAVAEGAARPPMSRFGKACTGNPHSGGPDELESERDGWWLPARRGFDLAPFPPTPIEWVPASLSCSYPLVSGRELGRCMGGTKLRLVGESIMGHVQAAVSQHMMVTEDPRSQARKGAFHWNFHLYNGMPDFESPKGPNPVGPAFAKVHEVHGFASLFSNRLVPDDKAQVLQGVPMDTQFIAFLVGANDFMRETSDMWMANVRKFMDYLEKKEWNGVLVWVTPSARQYKQKERPGECHCPATANDRPCFCANLEDVYFEPAWETVPGTGERRRVTAPDGRPTGRYVWREEGKVDDGVVPFIYDTLPRQEFHGDAALDYILSRRPYPATRVIDMHAMTNALPPTHSMDGIHYASSNVYTVPLEVNGEAVIPGLGTVAVANAIVSLVCNA